MTNASWEEIEAILQKHALLPQKPKQPEKDDAPNIQTWVRVYPAASPVAKGAKRP